MNKIFENEYTMEKKYFKEYVYNVLCRKMIFSGILLIILGIVLFVILDGNNAYMTLSAMGIIGAASILTPGITTKQLEEAEKRLNNGIIKKTVVKFSDNIVMEEGKVHLEFEYNQITKIVQTKNFIVLKTSEESAILVLKNGFVRGNENDFMNFIEKKINKNNL